MQRHINSDPEREVLKKIQIAQAVFNATPQPAVKAAALRELENLYKELEEIRNSK